MINWGNSYKLIEVLSFDDIFGGREGYAELMYFSSLNDFFDFFENVQTLPISKITSKVNVADTYSGGYTTYSEATKEDNMIILKQRYLSRVGFKENIGEIKVSDFSYISVLYLTKSNAIVFSFETEQDPQILFILAFELVHRVRLATNKLKLLNNVSIEPLRIGDLYKIVDILHDDKLKWHEKSIFIHQIILNNQVDFRLVSSDRKTQIEKWVNDCKNVYWNEIQEADDFDDCICECSEHLYDWIDFSCVALAQTVLFIVSQKQITLTAKAIMIYIAFHSYSDNFYENRTIYCMQALTKDTHNSTESALKQLVKKGWVTSSKFHGEDIWDWDNHVYEDDYYYFTNEFENLIGWNVGLGNPITY